MVKESTPSKSSYVIHFSGGQPVETMDHLTCFLPGMLALGAYGKTKNRDIELAKNIMSTCFDLYACSFSGLAPEVFYLF